MKLLFLLFLCLPVSCSAGYLDWLQNIFLGKKYQVVQAYDKQNYDQSLADLCELMNQDPYNPEYNYNVGTVLYKQQKYADAQQAFMRAAENVDAPLLLQEQAYFNAGNCWYQLEQWQKAVDAYGQVLKMHEDNQEARHNLQLALYKLKEQQMQDQSQQQQEHQNQQKDDQSSQDSKNCDGQGQGNQQGNKNKDQQSQSGKNSDNDAHNDGNQDASDDKKTGQEQGKDQQQGNNKQDQQKGSQEQSEQQGQEQDGVEHDQEYADTGDRQSGIKEQADQKEDQGIKEKNNKALQDLADKVDQAGQSNQAQHDDQNDQRAMPDVTQGHDDKKEMGGLSKKPELKNELQQQYESKASDDERLSDYHASVMKTLEELEEKIQKHVIKNKVAVQGAGQNGKKGW